MDIDVRMLVGGLCADGETAAEVAARFGVPVDDATRQLEGLARHGHLTRDPDGAYRVVPLDQFELRELYVVQILLEGLALRSCAPFTADQIGALRAANERLRAAAGDTAAAVAADDDFHRALVAPCANDELKRTHDESHVVLGRFERDWRGDPERIDASVAGHERIIVALESGDHDEAAREVRRNYESAIPG